MNKVNTNEIVEQGSELLGTLQIDMEVLQREKEQRFPLMTDAQFARLLRIKPATYSDYKSKKKAVPSLQVALRAAFALGLDLRTLVPQSSSIEEFFSKMLR